MSLNKNNIVIFFLIIFWKSSFSQIEKTEDGDMNDLEEVVITGQYNPQSIRKSVNNVIVINREQIENQAANNLADLLNYNLNLTIIPDSQSGKSTISFFSLDAQYFNVLIDNVPLVSDSGFGNNIDSTQINLDDIECIEIVEGAMSVEYGANAVTGVINIIKKHVYIIDTDVDAFTYADFALTDVVDANFTSDQRSVGSSWRNGGGPSSLPSLKENVFYVVNDTDGNYYKLQFLTLTNADGERGYPEFVYSLLQ